MALPHGQTSFLPCPGAPGPSYGGIGPSYAGVWGLKSLRFEGPRVLWSVWVTSLLSVEPYCYSTSVGLFFQRPFIAQLVQRTPGAAPEESRAEAYARRFAWLR